MIPTLLLVLHAAAALRADARPAASRAAVRVVAETPKQVAQSLLDADRRFAAAAARTDMVSALSAMFADGVIMPTPTGGFAMGKAEAVTTLRANPDAATSRVTWTPIRVGVSADGLHGFSFGFLTQTKADSTRIAQKYMAYWAREGGTWRVIAYKRGRSAGAPPDLSLMAPAIPTAIVAVRRDAELLNTLRADLQAAEAAFSAKAQQVGLGNAFAEFGREDAVNMGGPGSATYVVGASAIAALVAGGDMTASRVHWGADTAFVATSGDLGITFGRIHPNAPPAGAPAGPGSPFFTIWYRASAGAPWRYIAE